MSDGLPVWLRAAQDGVTIAVSVQPNAGRSSIVGPHGETLKIKVSSPPVEGAANAALLEFLAARLQIRVRMLEVVQGATARKKVIKIRGVSPEAALAALGPGVT